MLRLHILNVAHGDSAVVEFRENNHVAFGVIDSNRHDGEAKALIKLKQLSAEELSFVCLTHPHRDHYTGMFDLLAEFQGRTKQFYTFPLGDVINDKRRLKALAEKCRALCDAQDDPDVKRGLMEFLKILRFATEHFLPDNWIECAGEDSRLAPPDFAGVTIKTIQPPRRAKGDYYQRIASPEIAIAEHIRDNDLSIALQIGYRGHEIVLGGDATLDNWIWHKKWRERAKTSLQTRVVKLPHHGSRIDCDPLVMQDFFVKDGDRFAVISANGRSHPDKEVLAWLEAEGVSPYCTNLVPQCGANVTSLMRLPQIDPVLARWLLEVSETSAYIQACQGDVTITIDDSGVLSVQPQFGHPCGYRGDYRALFGA